MPFGSIRAESNHTERKMCMIPIEQLTKEQASGIRYILTDIDDTITTHGKLPACAYDAMWRLHDAGYKVIPVTGRSCGWCDLIAREWPAAAVVGENGAVVYYMEEGHLKVFTHPSVAGDAVHKKLEDVKEACLKGVPGTRVAKDQFSRVYDLAIDFGEEPPYLGLDAAEKIKDICVSMGAQAKVSSIHVNAWFGDYNKLSMTKLFMETVWGEKEIRDKILWFGDSPNDEPMFAYFPNSCGVANIKPFVERIQHLPTFVAPYEGGEGFAAAIDHLLKLQPHV